MNEITNRDNEPQQESQSTPEIAETKIEIELSPEEIEKIMGKVQDINVFETAFHVINTTYALAKSGNENLSKILKDGLLGVLHPDQPITELVNSKMTFKENLRTKKIHPQLYFHMVGRAPADEWACARKTENG